MLVKNVDLNHIDKLLRSVPDAIEIKSIDLTNGYQLILVAGDEEIKRESFENSLNDLVNILKKYDNIDNEAKQKLFAQNKKGINPWYCLFFVIQLYKINVLYNKGELNTQKIA